MRLTVPPRMHAAGQRCWVGNGLGQLEVLDVQAQAFVGAVKGFSGEVVPRLNPCSHFTTAGISLILFQSPHH